MCLAIKYCVKDPNFYRIENTLYNHVSDYGKKFQLFKMKCLCKLVFMGAVYNFKSDGITNLRLTNYSIKKLITIENVDIDSLIYLQ